MKTKRGRKNLKWGKKNLLSRVLRYRFIFLVIIGLLLGIGLFYLLLGEPTIGIIQIKGQISSATVEEVVQAVQSAQDDRNIRAIVLQINSPGGEASHVEEIYINLLKLRETKPIVASIDRLAASGAYYVALTANFIYAKPSSDVGNIGVVSVLPQSQKIDEDTIITGPFKKVQDRKTFARNIQLVKESFLKQVLLQRSSKLLLSKEELAEARLYQGLDAVAYGLIDAIGSQTEAVEKAAELAGIRNYDTTYLNKHEGRSIILWLAVNESFLRGTNTVPLHYYLYIQKE